MNKIFKLKIFTCIHGLICWKQNDVTMVDGNQTHQPTEGWMEGRAHGTITRISPQYQTAMRKRRLARGGVIPPPDTYLFLTCSAWSYSTETVLGDAPNLFTLACMDVPSRRSWTTWLGYKNCLILQVVKRTQTKLETNHSGRITRENNCLWPPTAKPFPFWWLSFCCLERHLYMRIAVSGN